MSNNLIQKLGCADVYRTYVLLLTADKNTLITDTTIDQLASFVGDKPANYKSGKSSKSFNDKLRATWEVAIQNKDSGRNDRTWTDYIFSPVSFGHYRRINRFKAQRIYTQTIQCSRATQSYNYLICKKTERTNPHGTWYYF